MINFIKAFRCIIGTIPLYITFLGIVKIMNKDKDVFIITNIPKGILFCSIIGIGYCFLDYLIFGKRNKIPKNDNI